MEVYFDEKLKKIKQLVLEKARYQKVMLLYDESVESSLILDVYQELAGNCIFNQSNMDELDLSELNNGYRLIIFLCSIDSFVRCNINLDEFICVFCPEDESFLPYYLSNDNRKQDENRFLLTNKSSIDVNSVSSVYFNKFYNYLVDLLTKQTSNVEFDFEQKEITQFGIFKMIDSLENNFNFEDLKILKSCQLDYKFLSCVDLVLIDGFFVLIKAVKEGTISLVDIYKVTKGDLNLVDKFYSMVNNETFFNLVNLNYNRLINACVKTKERILEYTSLSCSKLEVEEIITKIKTYSKKLNSVISYLYIYNVFGV